MKPKHAMTRRDFLRYSALTGSAALLVACAPAPAGVAERLHRPKRRPRRRQPI